MTDVQADGDPDAALRAEVLAGLRGPRKALPPKLFYDARGSELFDRITGLPEYYPTRSEIGLLSEHGDAIARCMAPERGRGVTLVEPGSGASAKVPLLLQHLPHLEAYVPVEISQAALDQAVEQLRARFPDLRVIPVSADYTRLIDLPELGGTRAVFFPGSTIGNFEPFAAAAFLKRLARVAAPNGTLVIGVDLRKDPAVLHAAYDDAQGVTAEFNRNMLRHINRRLGSDFVPERFAHEARWDDQLGRVEMHLVSLGAQEVRIGEERVAFLDGESIHTESSYKYTIEGFQQVASQAGFAPRQVWTDGLFSVHCLAVGPG